MTKCNCELLDDDLLEVGWTCWPCYELMKDNPEGWNK
jgi:hypothetical protein